MGQKSLASSVSPVAQLKFWKCLLGSHVLFPFYTLCISVVGSRGFPPKFQDAWLTQCSFRSRWWSPSHTSVCAQSVTLCLILNPEQETTQNVGHKRDTLRFRKAFGRRRHDVCQSWLPVPFPQEHLCVLCLWPHFSVWIGTAARCLNSAPPSAIAYYNLTHKLFWRGKYVPILRGVNRFNRFYSTFEITKDSSGHFLFRGYI